MQCGHISKLHYGVHVVGSSFHPKPFLRMTKHDGISSKRPVVRLVKALYGHLDAGTFWEQRCADSVRSMRW